MAARSSKRTRRIGNCAHRPPQAQNRWPKQGESVIRNMSYKMPIGHLGPIGTGCRCFFRLDRFRFRSRPSLKLLPLVLLIIHTLNDRLVGQTNRVVDASGVAPTIDYSHNMRVLKLPKSTRPNEIIYRLRASDGDQNDQLHFGVAGAQGRALLDIVQVPGSWKEADVYLRHRLEAPLDLEGAESANSVGSLIRNNHQNKQQQEQLLAAATQLDDPLYTAVYNVTIYVADATNKTTQIESTILVTNDDLLESPNHHHEDTDPNDLGNQMDLSSGYETGSTISGDLQEQTKYLQSSSSNQQLANNSLISRLPLNLPGSTRLKTQHQRVEQPAQLSPFIRPRHVFAVAENGQPGESIGFLTVRESDKSDLPVRFELRGQGSDHFNIRYVFGPRGQSRAELVLSQPVDYERQNLFKLKVLALNAWTNVKYDTRNVATLDIVIAVGDVQDTPPHFKQLPQTLQLNSQMRPDDLVARFEAEDGDYADQRPIGFALDASSPLSSFFTIDKLNGELRLARPWQELSLQQPSLMMRLAASSSPLQQLIGHQPSLSSPWLMQLTVFASELPDAASGYDHLWPAMFARAELPLQLVDLVNEPPRLIGGLLTETSGGTAVSSTSLTVPTLRSFIREFANSDRSSEEVASSQNERAGNSEGWPAGQLVQWYVSKNYSVGDSKQADPAAQLVAHLVTRGRGRPMVVDFGQGSNGTFELFLEGPDAHLFELEPSHPVNKLTLFNLFVSPNANRSLFDFDAIPSTATTTNQRVGGAASVSEPPTRSFHVEVVARDFGLPQRQTMRVKCLIDLVDINDNAPQFDLDLYTFSIFENAQIGQILGSIRARDMDRLSGVAGVLSGQYQRVRYTSLTGRDSHLFRLDQESGLITLEGSLDREKQDHYLLLAEARDMSGQASNYTKILVNVMDVNDNAPVFSQSHYDAVLLPDGTFHQPLVVSALDLDEPSSANSQVAYEIIAGNQNEQFAIDALSGAIYPTGNLAPTTRPLQIPSILSEPILPYIRTQGDQNNNKPDQHGKILPSPNGPGREIEETAVPISTRGSQHQHQSPLRLNWPRSVAPSSLDVSSIKPDQSSKAGQTSPVQRGFTHSLDRDELVGSSQHHNQAPKQHFDASKVPPVTTLVVRAHDFGIPLRSATCKVNIYNQALLSRSLSVILNGTAEQLEQRRDLIERSFGALTGSRVQIESIDALSESSSISVARLKLAIPAGHSLIDLTDLSALMTAIDYRQPATSCPTKSQSQQNQNLDHFRHPIHYITTGDRIYPVHQTPGVSGNITSAEPNGASGSANTANTAIFADFSPLDYTASQLERKLLFYIIIVGICILALLVIWMVYFCCREDQQQHQERRRRLKTIDSFETTSKNVRGNARSNRGVQAESLEDDSLGSLGAGGKRDKNTKENRFKGPGKSSSRTRLIENEQQLPIARSASQLDLDDDDRQCQNSNKTLAKTIALGSRHAIGNNLLKQQHQLSIPSNIKPEHYSMYNGQVWFEQGGLMRPVNDHSGTMARLSQRRASSAPSVGARSLDSGLHAIINGSGRLSAISPVNSGLNTPPHQRGQFFPNTLGYARNLANIAPPSGGAYIYPTPNGGGQRQHNFLGSKSRGRVVPMSMTGRGGDFTNEAFEATDFQSTPGGGLVMVPFVAGQMGSATQGQTTSSKSRHRHHRRSSKSASSSSASRSDSTRTLDEEDEAELDHESVLLDSDQELLGFDSTGTPIIATRTRQKAPETTTSYLLPPFGGGSTEVVSGGGTGASSPAATVINMSPTKATTAIEKVANGSTRSKQQQQQTRDKAAQDDGKPNAEATKKTLPDAEPRQIGQESERDGEKTSALVSSRGRKSMDLMGELNERLNSANKQRALKRQGADDGQQEQQQKSPDEPQQRDATKEVIDQTARVDNTDESSPGHHQKDEPSLVSERPIATDDGANNGASAAVVATTFKPGGSLATATNKKGDNETERRQAFAGRRASETMSCQSQSTISETTSELTTANGVDQDNRLGDMKNGELLKKQSIFALTYSGLATDKLPS